MLSVAEVIICHNVSWNELFLAECWIGVIRSTAKLNRRLRK